jgi:hypothetical protein
VWILDRRLEHRGRTRHHYLTTQEISGINQPTALSVPYLLDKLAPAFANAAK